jgi:hypothetical protein
MMMVCSRKIASSWRLLMVLGWLVGCSQTQPAIRPATVPIPNLPPAQSAADKNPLEPETVQPVPAPSQPPTESWFIHKVKWPRETLFSIARWYTGSGNHWQQLAAANPTIKPQSMQIGDAILIPEVLLKTRSPMPSEYPNPTVGKKKSSPMQENPKPALKVGDFQLYGPIEKEPQTADPNSALTVPLETLD